MRTVYLLQTGTSSAVCLAGKATDGGRGGGRDIIYVSVIMKSGRKMWCRDTERLPGDRETPDFIILGHKC